MNYYYADSDNQTVGPINEEQLHELYRGGSISLDSFIIAEGQSDWKPYRSIKPPNAPPPRDLTIMPPPIRSTPVETRTLVPERKSQQCPFCAEEISPAAKKCKHCGETLDVALRAAEEAKRSNSNQPMVFMNAAGGGVAVASKKNFPHLLHFIVTLFTMGIWLPIWILHYLFRDRKIYD